MAISEVEVLERLESEIMEIKEMRKRLETNLIGEEEITEEERKELEKRDETFSKEGSLF